MLTYTLPQNSIFYIYRPVLINLVLHTRQKAGLVIVIIIVLCKNIKDTRYGLRQIQKNKNNKHER